MGNICRKKKRVLPEEFVSHMKQLELIRIWTLETADWLEKVALGGDDPSIDGKKKGMKHAERRIGALERLDEICTKYGGQIVEHEYSAQLSRFGIACKRMNKNALETHEQAMERVVLPLRKWATEKYPIMIKDMQSCQARRTSLQRAEKALTSHPRSAKHKANAESARNAFNSQFNYCLTEMRNTEKVWQQHILHLRTYMELQWRNSYYGCLQLNAATTPTALLPTA